MFLKPFRVKTQTAIKGSDRKKLRADIGRQFNIDASLLTDVIPNKEEMTVMKLYTHAGDNVVVFNLQNNPIFFEVNRTVYPTVYILWKYPDLLPTFTTWPPVFKKLMGGADLMLPGVIVKGDVTPTTFGSLKKGDSCSVKLLGNRAPVAVGNAALSAGDMYESAMRGKGVLVLHSYTDQLWAFGNKSQPPVLEDSEMGDIMDQDSASDDSETENKDSDPEGPVHNGPTDAAASGAGASCVDGGIPGPDLLSVEKLSVTDTALGAAEAAGGEEDGEDGEEEEEEEDPKVVQARMDDLLLWCCLCALKSRVKKADLPLLTSNFFRNFLQPCCPAGQVVDVKKSSYKKLSKFLKAIQDRGLIRVKELTKGVESIIEVTKDHLELRDFAVPKGSVVEAEEAPSVSTADNTYKAPEITDMFVISAASAPFFKLCGRRKGNALSAVEVRQCLTDYIKQTELKAEQKGYVQLDPMLSDLVLHKGEYLESLKWEDVITRALGKMSPAYRLTFQGHEPVIKKGKLEPVSFQILQRGGNKKVTLVHNLELYGIDPHEFAHHIQIGRACSTSVSPMPGKNQGIEVLVQGNQINFISNMLIDKYKIPKKYLVGLEKAPKSGKKKR